MREESGKQRGAWWQQEEARGERKKEKRKGKRHSETNRDTKK